MQKCFVLTSIQLHFSHPRGPTKITLHPFISLSVDRFLLFSFQKGRALSYFTEGADLFHKKSQGQVQGTI